MSLSSSGSLPFLDLRSPDDSVQLDDSDEVARGVTEGAVANPVGLVDRLLDDLGYATLQPLEGAIEVLVARLMWP
jgi:hypothetical protein